MNLLFIIQNLKKHLWKRNNLYLVLFTAAVLYGCSKEPENKKYIARVNDSFLTSDDLDGFKDTSFFKSELIRNWINEELLYQEALNEGILDDEEFNSIISNSKRELAGAMLLQKVSEKYQFSYSDSDLEEFYQNNKNDFALKKDAYLLNAAEFNNEEDAINFRSSVLLNNWQNVVELKNQNEFLSIKENVLLTENDIPSPFVKNILQELYPQELSIVIQTDSLRYTVFQVIDKYTAGTIPPFNLIKKDVEKRFVTLEKRKFINEYIKKLYAENDIEVKIQDYE